MKRIGVVLMVLSFVFPIQVHAGNFGKGDASGTPGQWYEGFPPSYVDPAKSPVVFIHGLNSSSHTWWEDNDMYEMAYENGFETAFVDLYPTNNMWDNGRLLAEKLEEIYNHFGENLVIIGHSKGGIDTQSALVHYGADSFVDRVITLSSPHQGSELANLAYSSWAGWLADIIGGKNDATYSLQTGYMDYFRQQTDPHNSIPLYTLAGTNWGAFGSSLYWGGLYLSSYGANDGAVTVKSSALPYSTELQVGKWNHSEIRTGRSTFSYFSDYLYETTEDFQAKNVSAFKTEDYLSADTYLRGGHYKGYTLETFSVEENAEEITINWISDQKDSTFTLTDPEGDKWSSFDTKPDETIVFEGSFHHTLTVDRPSAGKWKLEAYSPEEHYLLTVQFDSLLNEAFNLEIGRDLEVSFSKKPPVQAMDQKNVKSVINLEYYKNGKQKARKVKWDDLDGTSSQKLANLGEGVYNLTIDLEGKTPRNEKFNRTIVTSIYVDGSGRVIK